MRRLRLIGCLLVGCLLAPISARANALDTFGLSARSEGLAGAMAAEARGYVAAHHNPGGVALSDDIEAAVTYGGASNGLTLDGKDAQVPSARGTSIGLSIPVKIRSFTLAFGIALYMPDQYVARIQIQPVGEPHFVLLDNNLQHIVVTPVGAIRLTRWLSIGAGATILADAAGNGITFDVGVASGGKVGKAALDVALPTRAAATVGVTVLPTPWLRIGAAYRGALDLGLKLDILANVNIVGVITGDTVISLRAINFHDPQRVTLGVAADLTSELTFTTELTWINWGAFTGAVPDLKILVALGITPPLVDVLFPNARFNDIWVPRAGIEYRRDVHPKVGLRGRVGYAYERSPVPPQTGLTSFADNDRHVVALGIGVELRRLISILPKPLRLDVAMQLHQLVGRATAKDPLHFAGQGFASGGFLAHLAATLEARF